MIKHLKMTRKWPAELNPKLTSGKVALSDTDPFWMRWRFVAEKRDYQEYREGLYTEEYLQKRSPFVWMEAHRQGLL